jgi:ABC-type branched-subunit amino acid transport system substrate-binding protein
MRAFLASLVAVVSLGVVATPAAVTAQTNDPVRIGLEAPLTGDQKRIGIGMLDGAKLAASEMNARGGLLGRKVEIVPIDDAADPATGEKAANAAIAEGLDGVVGPYNSGVGAKTLPLYLAAGVVPIRLTSADATAGLGFTLQPMTSQIAPVAAEALTTWAQAKSVAIIYDQTALYTQSV